jgi:sigma-B regulation protein RsbU (phosphoserine phosphatase)
VTSTSEGKQTILIVDDDRANIRMVQFILKGEYTIRVATSGRMAFDLVKIDPPPDLILLDVTMSEMDGYEVCCILKATRGISDIPVIFLTGNTEASDETKGFAAGAVDYIHKPFSPSVVKARIRTHLMLRKARQQLAQQLVAVNDELEMAREIQLSILPRETPNIKGVHITTRFVPTSSVAGDFYDFIVVGEQHVGILIADVSGHGLPAALIASMLHAVFAAQSGHAAEPKLVLAGLNQALCGKFIRHFVTAAYLFVDMENNFLSYAAAGHPPLVRWRTASGSISEISEGGLILGPFPEATYSEVHLPVEAGDRVILYTDGILEAMNPAEKMFGADRFKRYLQSNSSLKGGPLADSLLDELSRWTELPNGHRQQDDITLVLVEF